MKPAYKIHITAKKEWKIYYHYSLLRDDLKYENAPKRILNWILKLIKIKIYIFLRIENKIYIIELEI